MKSHKILIVDDDPHIRDVVSFALKKAGYEVEWVKDGRQCLDIYEQINPDLIILDIMMPEMDGTDVCLKIRSCSNVPIIFLSSKDEEVDRIIGLELGGDDYVTKPFSPRELVARVKAILRREGMNDRKKESVTPYCQETGNSLEHGRLRLDMDRFSAFWDDIKITLTATEFGILHTILRYPGKVYSRDELMNSAYNVDTVVTDRTIDSHVRRVRQKFKEIGVDPIDTVHGIGYKLGSCK